MSQDLHEEEEEQIPMITPKAIMDSCVKNQLYTIPELNDVLYLHFSGYQKIANLEPYVNLTSIWLNNNAIYEIEGLDTLINLVCLYLQGNVIQEIKGLEKLVNLETLVLSHNYISKITGLEHCPKLHTLEIDHNRLKDAASIEGLLAVKDSIGVLNLADNKFEDESLFEVIFKLPNLGVLKLEGNEIARTMSGYRRKIITTLTNLNYLDSQPVTAQERRIAIVYLANGPSAAMQERIKIKEEKEAEDERNRKQQRRIYRETARKQGIDISHDRFFLSSDDELPEDHEGEENLGKGELEKIKIEQEKAEEEDKDSSDDFVMSEEKAEEKFVKEQPLIQEIPNEPIIHEEIEQEYEQVGGEDEKKSDSDSEDIFALD